MITGFKSFDFEAGYLFELVQMQAITRGEAKNAA
jgi:hypothetical protein